MSLDHNKSKPEKRKKGKKAMSAARSTVPIERPGHGRFRIWFSRVDLDGRDRTS